MNDKKFAKVNIGIDVGIASVGWAILSEENQIFDMGVRLFDTVDDARSLKLLSESRREARSLRRRLARTKTRKRDAIKLFILHGLFKPQDYDPNDPNYWKRKDFVAEFQKYIQIDKNEVFNVYENRNKLLETEEKNTKNFLRTIYWYLTHRGFTYELLDDKEKEAKKKYKTKDQKKAAKPEFNWSQWVKGMLAEHCYPIKLQLEISHNKDFLPAEMKELGQPQVIYKLKNTINMYFQHEDYQRELKQILSKQTFLQQEFIDGYLAIFNRQRDYAFGPGGPKSPSAYGLYQEENGEIEQKYENLWEKTERNCPLHPEEKCAPYISFSNYIFSVLSYLNNLKYDDSYLSKEAKESLLNQIIDFNSKKISDLTNKKITKAFCELFDNPLIVTEDIDGFLTSEKVVKKAKKQDKKIKSFPVLLREIKDLFQIIFESKFIYKGNNQLLSSDIIDLIDQICFILSKYKTVEKRENELKNDLHIQTLIKNNFEYSEQEFEEQYTNVVKKISILKGFSKTANLSLKALKFEIPYLLDKPWNHNKFIIENDLFFKKDKQKLFETYPNSIHRITSEWIDEAVLSPTVKRAIKQTIKLLNALFHYCQKNNWEIKNIVVEMPRENNNAQRKKKIIAQQKKIKERKEEILSYFPKLNRDTCSSRLLLKLELLIEQDFCDAYDGTRVEHDDTLDINRNYEIDHIIPRSISFDNSRKNLVLTKRNINNSKSNQFINEFLRPNELIKMRNKWNEWYIDDKDKLKTLKISRKEFEDNSDFIGRNLSDTRYIAAEIFNVIKSFVDLQKEKQNPIFHNTFMKTITGRWTGILRSEIYKNSKIRDNFQSLLTSFSSNGYDNKKNRMWHGTHAQDAVLIAYSANNYRVSKLIEKTMLNHFTKGSEYSPKYEFDNDYSKFVDDLNKLVQEINKFYPEIKFSKKINFKNLSKFYNEQLVKGKLNFNNETDFFELKKINKVPIVKIKNTEFRKYFDEKNKDFKNPLIYTSNNPLWQQMKQIFNMYKDSEFPFKKAIEEQKENSVKQANFINMNDLVVSLNENSVFKIGNISYLSNKSKFDQEIFRVNNSNAFYESFNWDWIDVIQYEIKEEIKYLLVPANIKLIKIINSDKHQTKKEQILQFNELDSNLSLNLLDIKHTNKKIYNIEAYKDFLKYCLKKELPQITKICHLHRLFKNSVILHENYDNINKFLNIVEEGFDNIMIVTGFAWTNQTLELKSLKFIPQKLEDGRQDRILLSLNSLRYKKYKFFADMDMLGKVFNKKEIL